VESKECPQSITDLKSKYTAVQYWYWWFVVHSAKYTSACTLCYWDGMWTQQTHSV